MKKTLMRSLRNIVNRFVKARVLVVGDIILDEYIWGKVERISPEAPVPVVWAARRSFVPGGAANVAVNIRDLDAKVCLAGVVGEDKNAQTLKEQLKKDKISTAALITEPNRHTTVKTRIIAGHQQVVRVDWEHTHHISRESNRRVVAFIKKQINNFDALIVEDYGKGVVNPQLLEEIIALARRNKKIVTVDPKEEHFLYYRGATCITPNRKELENAVRNLRLKDTANRFRVYEDCLFTDHEIDLAAKEIISYLKLDSLLVTLGEEGMRLFEKDGSVTRIPTVAQEVFDVSGAGDTAIAVFTLALSSGGSRVEAACLSNLAAGIVVGKLGTATTNRRELKARIR